MTLRTLVLGGAAAVALACGTPSFGQQLAPTTQDQNAPAAPSDQATPSAAPSSDSASTSKPRRHHAHHRRLHTARFGSNKEERAETRRLNQDQLARARGGSGSYGTLQERQPAVPGSEAVPPAANPSNWPQPAAPNSNNAPPPAAPNTSTPQQSPPQSTPQN